MHHVSFRKLYKTSYDDNTNPKRTCFSSVKKSILVRRKSAKSIMPENVEATEELCQSVWKFMLWYYFPARLCYGLLYFTILTTLVGDSYLAFLLIWLFCIEQKMNSTSIMVTKMLSKEKCDIKSYVWKTWKQVWKIMDKYGQVWTSLGKLGHVWKNDKVAAIKHNFFECILGIDFTSYISTSIFNGFANIHYRWHILMNIYSSTQISTWLENWF